MKPKVDREIVSAALSGRGYKTSASLLGSAAIARVMATLCRWDWERGRMHRWASGRH